MALVFRITSRNTFASCKLSQFFRSFSDDSASSEGGAVERRGLILGVYSDPEEKEHKLTAAAQKFNSHTGGKLEELLKEGIHLRRGKTHMFQNLDPEFHSVAVVGLGKEDIGFNPLENLDECKETIRIAAAAGTRRLRKMGMTKIRCEGMGHTESAAEGAGLAAWRYQEQKSAADQRVVPKLKLYHDEDKDGWQRGLFKAEAQNLARRLSDTPANLMTPAIFAQNAVDALCPCGISVEVRDKDWMENKKMNALLAVARGSCEPPVFLEMGYCGGSPDEKPIVLVGKGITFDSGGLCLKKCKVMPEYRADMTGAAVVVAVMRAVAALSLPLNVQAVVPLCENMMSGMALKPGDVVTTMNGKTILVENTDNEGRLMLADALTYATMTFKPRLVLDIAAFTRGMRVAVGASATGVFSNNHDLWKQMEKAGSITGDRVWRFPLWKHFSKKMKKISNADLTNVGEGHGNPCKGAAFLKEFVPCGDWIHMDTNGTGMLANHSDFPYLSKGRMTGRPTRTVIQFLYQLACPSVKK